MQKPINALSLIETFCQLIGDRAKATEENVMLKRLQRKLKRRQAILVLECK